MACLDNSKGNTGRALIVRVGQEEIHVVGTGPLPTLRIRGVGEIDLGAVVRHALSLVAGTGSLDLYSAHYNYDTRTDLPEDARRKLLETTGYYQSLSFPQAALLFFGLSKGKGEHSIESVIAAMLTRETALSVREKRILAYDYNTRQTIDHLLSQLLGRHEKVAIPLPNWHFWEMEGYKQKKYGHEYFDAHDEQQFVGNFGKVAARRDVRALMVVTPANPLMFTLSPDAAKEIDQIALREGVDIIVDDVLRGVQPPGNRHSMAEYFTRPYLVEGFSKRFGDEPFGRLSYILLPEKSGWRSPSRGTISRIFSPAFGELLHAACEHSTEPAIEELRARNQAFDEGIHVHCPDVEIKRPSDSHIVSLVLLPGEFHGNAGAFRYALFHQRRVAVGWAEDFYPNGYLIPPDKQMYLRASIGKYSADRIRGGAEALGLAMKEHGK